MGGGEIRPDDRQTLCPTEVDPASRPVEPEQSPHPWYCLFIRGPPRLLEFERAAGDADLVEDFQLAPHVRTGLEARQDPRVGREKRPRFR